ncbi:PqqD family protein [Abyssisolibacter fermentans]|uniref:PqqD family protein n=1 Tax=Abyssisolibacter fermentans TaxID=1766203 RepID=UPI000834E67F|nr:PqqD family protein [Abyssisolibacter fermentans]
MKNILYKRNIVYRVRTINKRNILFGGNQCFELNELALLVWNSLNGEITIDELSNKILEQYDEDKEVIKKDVSNFIAEMVKDNVILESE